MGTLPLHRNVNAVDSSHKTSGLVIDLSRRNQRLQVQSENRIDLRIIENTFFDHERSATFFSWWANVVKEAQTGYHTPVVQLHMRYGMILFIASEVMFFVGWFWAFFDFALFPSPIEFDGTSWVNRIGQDGAAAAVR